MENSTTLFIETLAQQQQVLYPRVEEEPKTLSIRNLSVLAYSVGFTLWVYRDLQVTMRDITRAGFFKDAQNMLQTGDHIHLHVADFDALGVYREKQGHSTVVIMTAA